MNIAYPFHELVDSLPIFCAPLWLQGNSGNPITATTGSHIHITSARAHTHTSLSLIHVQLLPAHERICLYHMYVCTNWLLSFCRYRLLSTYLYMCYSNTFDMHVTVKAKHSKETHTSGLALLANGRASGTTYLPTALLHLQAATIRCSVTFVCSCHLSTPNTK